MKKLLSVIVLSASYFFSNAQQAPQYTQYNSGRYIINPAVTGENEYFTGVLGYRRQWVGLGDEPTTIFAGGHIGLRKNVPAEREPLALRTSRPNEFHSEQKESKLGKFKHGVGFHIISDKYGAFNKNVIGLNYALHIPLKKDVNLSFGTSASFNNASFNQNKAVPTELNDAVYQSFIDNRSSLNMLDINFGCYLYSPTYFIGYASNQLLGDKIDFGSNGGSRLVLHHSIITGYHYQINDDLMITPSTYVKAVGGAPISYDINVRGDYKNFFGGLTYRSQDAIAIILGLFINDKISVGYSYDLNTSKLNKYNSGGHELVLSLGKKRENN